MGVVLGEGPHANHAAQLAALLVAIDRAELGESQRQVAIAARDGLVDVDVVRAVHGSQQETFLLNQLSLRHLSQLLQRTVRV